MKDRQRLQGIISNAINWARHFRSIHTSLGMQHFWFLKQDENMAVYQSAEKHVPRNFEDDRQFPLETVALKQFNAEHGTDIDNATIHVGPYADEYARSFHALAVTVRSHIFFRDGAYKPETEEGRKIRTHELTHVAQHKEGRITHNADRDVLEREAQIAESQEEYEDDPLQEIEIGGKTFLLRPSEHPEVIADAKKMTERWLEEQKFILDEKKYIQLLLRHEKLKERMV